MLFGPPNVEKLAARRDTAGLVRALSYQKNADVPQAAAKALGQLGDPAAVPALIAAFTTGCAGPAIHEALLALGEASMAPLLAAAQGPDLEIRRHALWTLADTGDARACEAHLANMRHEDQWVRAAAAGGLGSFRGDRVVEALIRALEDEVSYVRKQAATSLATAGDARAIEPLIEALGRGSVLSDSDADARLAVAKALAAIGDARVMKPIRPVLRHCESAESNAIEQRLIERLAEIGAPSIAPCIAALDDDDVSWIARGALKKIGAAAVEPLARILADPAAPNRRDALSALSAIGLPECLELIAGALSDGDVSVRYGAAYVLGRRRDPRAVEPLIPFLESDDDWRYEAANILGDLGDQRAVGPLHAALLRAVDKDDYPLKNEAGIALRKLGVAI